MALTLRAAIDEAHRPSICCGAPKATSRCGPGKRERFAAFSSFHRTPLAESIDAPSRRGAGSDGWPAAC